MILNWYETTLSHLNPETQTKDPKSKLQEYLQAEVQQKRHQRVVPVKVAETKVAEFKDVIAAIGSARANEQVLITSKQADLVEEVAFQDGDIVEKGAILVKLNNQEDSSIPPPSSRNVGSKQVKTQKT